LGVQFTNIEVNYAEFFKQQLLGKAPLSEGKTVAKLGKAAKTSKAAPVIPADWKWIPKSKWGFFKSRVLFCENTTDSVTTPAATYRIKNVHPVFASKGFEVIVLKDVNDIRTNFAPKAKDPRVVYISGIGHGGYNSYTGHNFDPLLQIGVYTNDEVKKKSMHFLSCETARDLGPDTVGKGASSYAGYTENFVFDWDNANLYWQCDSQYDISMANGKTAEQAVADTIAKYNAAIASVPGTSTAATLLSDRNLLRSPVSGAEWGSKTARIYPYIFYYTSFAAFASR
jgi:hypothetical protein